VSESAKQLIRLMMKQNPKERLSVDEVLGH